MDIKMIILYSMGSSSLQLHNDVTNLDQDVNWQLGISSALFFFMGANNFESLDYVLLFVLSRFDLRLGH